MTEKQKKRRNRFNAKEDDFILADLKIIRDDEELSPVPLDHFPDDEDAIDRLLIDTDFDTENYKLEQVEWTFPPEGSQTIVYPDISNVAKIVEAQEKNPKIERQKSDMIADIKPEQDSTNNNAVEITAVNHNSLEQENILKQLNDCDHKIKKTAAITYASLAIGIVALISAIVMAVLISGMRTEISKLTELVSILEEDMVSITEKNSDMKFNSNDPSIEQLNQKVNSLTKQLHAQSISETSKSKLVATVIKQVAINKSFEDRQARIYKLVATSYASKIKKSLNLSSVSVASNIYR